MRAGDVGFIIHHDNWISRAISWFMGSRWSHCFIVLEKTDIHTYTVETSDFEVTIGTVDAYIYDPNVSIEVWSNDSLTNEDRDFATRKSFALYGENYGYFQLLSLGIRRILMKLRLPKIKNFIRLGVVCTAVPLYGLTQVKSSGLFGIDPEGIDTEEFYQKIVKSKKWKRIYTK